MLRAPCWLMDERIVVVMPVTNPARGTMQHLVSFIAEAPSHLLA